MDKLDGWIILFFFFGFQI